MKKKLTIALLIAGTIPAFVVFAATAATKTTATSATAKTTKVTTAAMAAAKTPFTYGVWLPFWTSQAGAQNISVNLPKLHEVSPFSYEIGGSGGLIDDLNIGNGSWNAWFESANELGVKIIPTIADFNGTAIYNMLSTTSTRQAEENAIAALVKKQSFDGIDIDFESMDPDTEPYYSLFIEGLAMRLHPQGKLLTCTIEPRTPAEDLYQTVLPSDLLFAEDYAVLNQYCDEVRVMAYDQDTIDLTLDAAKGNGSLYAPVADPGWAQSVLQLALQSISAKKVVLGIPTYGYEYEVSWQNGVTTYARIRAFDYLDAMARAASLGITPVRNSADELSFTYSSTTFIQASPINVSTVLSSQEPAVLINPPKTASGTPLTTFFVSFPDASSILDEINLAKQDGIRGVMLFKADGDIDPMTWNDMN